LSGDLKWIDAIDTLNLIAQAYFNVDQIAAREVCYLDATLEITSTIGMTVNGSPQIPLKQFMLTLLNPSHTSAQSAVAAALQKF
jgi:hypothetical protein